ncbi:MAG: copper amine oxidase N-terminal domain-containing protein [Brevibacillus sp.]|nr:copper amine oxidase N-terminal domain-containing protein [Brevibacillus sp.]
MKKFVVSSLAAALLLSPVAAYADSAPAQSTIETDFHLTTDTSLQKADVEAFAQLKALFDADSVDLAKVKEQYTANLQAKVQERIPDQDELILTVLDGAIAGQFTVGQAKQAVDKGLQGYFYAEITELTKNKAKTALAEGKKEEALAALEQAIQLYVGALQGTVVKRDNTYGTRMQEQLDTIIIPALQKAVEEGDSLSYNVYRQMFDKTLIKMFHLATLGYAKKISEIRDSQPEDTKAAITEGYFFFLPIYNSMAGGHQASADAIKAAFESGDASKIDEQAVKTAFLTALAGKISGYASKVLAADFTVQEQAEIAQEQAMEGNMFLSVAEILLKEKLGEQAYGELTAHAEQYYEAVKAKDKAQATAHIFPVLKALASLNGVELKVGSSSLLVNGEERKTDAASFIDPDSSRTLVPARALVEALGGTIAFNGETKQITITKDGDTYTFVIGGTEIEKNGKKLEIAFDQPALIKEGRTYIPLRAVSQMLGQKVFFHQQTILVLP